MYKETVESTAPIIDAYLIRISGLVQGVGFRPFVHRLACKYGLRGRIRNQTGDVLIEIEGTNPPLDQFVQELASNAPPLARIDQIHCQPAIPTHRRQFEIEPSEHVPGGAPTLPPDVATCSECLVELLDPNDRRFLYPFLNCAHCGPRFTIIRSLPYDREQTTLASFSLCPECVDEYRDPFNRRFHAQAIACPRCGPHFWALNKTGRRVEADDPIGWIVEHLRHGKIAAIKGLGGFHLACDALQAAAVNELRQRKQRDEKPFAVMVPDLESARSLTNASDAEISLLDSPQAPIVLLKLRRPTRLADAVAPGNPRLGLMLPYTPLLHLLLRRFGGPIVMTSGNSSEEPIHFEDEPAINALKELADCFLMHNRPIHMRCDDSVVKVVSGKTVMLRRSRGFAPAPIALPFRFKQPLLATGGHMKVTFAIGRDCQAVLSHHLGDLDHYASHREFVRAIAHYETVLECEPQLYAHDLHPDYISTHWALAMASQRGKRSLAVQHHHAHMASCMAENEVRGPVIGVTFDGTGFGQDGAVWGGEFLVGDYGGFERAAHLRYVRMPGGEQAIREPWRMAVAHLVDAEEPISFLELEAEPTRHIEMMLRKSLRCPWTSSCGRLLDAIASMIGLRQRTRYEGQPAIELEWLAEKCEPLDPYPFALSNTHPLEIDTRPLIAAAARDSRDRVDRSIIARRTHETLIEMIATVCGKLRARHGLS
ncbi:MAG: carbamoyltransferase HypF, partial [Verrucomicrobiota bacterium]